VTTKGTPRVVPAIAAATGIVWLLLASGCGASSQSSVPGGGQPAGSPVVDIDAALRSFAEALKVGGAEAALSAVAKNAESADDLRKLRDEIQRLVQDSGAAYDYDVISVRALPGTRRLF
jgi:hypothetical protein